jgi:hypothetical protein
MRVSFFFFRYFFVPLVQCPARVIHFLSLLLCAFGAMSCHVQLHETTLCDLQVCRNLVNAMRGCFESIRSIRRLFDKNILFHKWCAYIICLFATIHIGAHMFNVNRLVQTTNPKVI